ncbi:phosphatase PAP2 family protein [Faecalibacter bovis]|uniref:Phosphatase PAP2 family protein n=1 Tax=Faecalibacter bovis TaxID=2898187 RepID=A0ABX7XG49_9FLAO|nr:phosphatase PAP2 family protein [Faecalibacter bovis]QTV06891.1 phosphatase PAP2 family protein [Faecalibacter bovis]
MNSKDLIQNIWPFFIVFFCYNFIALAMTQYFGRDDFHLIVNQFHTPFLDTFFKFYTDYGTTGFLFVLITYIAYKSNWITLGYALITEGIASLINTLVKKTYFKHVHRPSYYFNQKHIDLYLIEGDRLQIPYTFPSGHTLLAVIIAMTLCTMIKNRVLQFIIALHFPLIAFSRIYLSKHFAIDTIGGAMLGFFTFILVYYILNNLNKDFLYKPIIKRKNAAG